MVSHAFYSALAPWFALSLLLSGRNPHPSRKRVIGAVVVAAGILIFPIVNFSAARWIALLEPNPSITLTALLAIALFARCGGPQLFREQDWRAAWIFGSIAALILYPMGLGLTSIDSYACGWQKIVPVATTVVATVLLLCGNRFGIVLLLTLLGMIVHPMESTNLWDSLMDPFYGGVALILTSISLYKIFTGHSGRARRKALP